MAEAKDVYIDMNYYFSKGVSSNENVKYLLSNSCSFQGMLTLDIDPAIEQFYKGIFTPSNLFKILFTDDLEPKCNSLDHQIMDMRRCRIEFSPNAFKYKYDSWFRQNGLYYLSIRGDNFLTEETDIKMCQVLRDSKKYTYQTDYTVMELPIDEHDFLENYVDLFDTFPILSQLIIIELFYLHYKLEDDFVKYDIIMALIKRLQTLDYNVTYNLTCVLYAYLILAKVTASKLNTDDAVYPADYWSNE